MFCANDAGDFPALVAGKIYRLVMLSYISIIGLGPMKKTLLFEPKQTHIFPFVQA